MSDRTNVVDVLAVMDLHAAAMMIAGKAPAELGNKWFEIQAQFSNARTAVAELIDAAEAYADSCYHVGNHDRLIAALAAVRPQEPPQ